MTEYALLLQRLTQLTKQKQPRGLDPVLQLCRLLDNPQDSFSSIHVAGTNGKGSVSTKIAKALEATGLRVGLYTSPHIHCFRERIQINGEKISEERFIAILRFLFSHIDREGFSLSFFDIITCMAFLYFAIERVDVAVLEVGIGGLTDATNVIMPRLSVITSISMDHMEMLGDTREAIARQKGGIIKPSIPVVIGPKVPKHVIEEIAISKNSPLHHVSTTFPTFDEENNGIAKMALTLLDIPKEAIKKGIATRPPCRMQYFSEHQMLFDVAHNPDGLKQLFTAIRQQSWGKGLIRVVCGLSRSKDIPECLAVLHKYVERIYFVEANNNRATHAIELMRQSAQQGFFATSAHTSISDGIEEAKANRNGRNILIVVCGTFFIMDEALGIVTKRDYENCLSV